ncbi:MAG: hypothetical protein J1F33_01660 [Clostridiales bacterium]|nr:hypothetical protein [Clostridiales bacterium]
MRKFEFCCNLVDLPNFETFRQTIRDVRKKFQSLFGTALLERLPLYVDNCTAGGGYVPTCYSILESIVCIKLNIADFTKTEQITYQFAHEMTHFVYRCLIGIDKKNANEYEESICSAMSLCMLYGNCKNFDSWCNHVKGLSNNGYRKGYDVAKECNFDAVKLKEKIEDEIDDYRKIAAPPLSFIDL